MLSTLLLFLATLGCAYTLFAAIVLRRTPAARARLAESAHPSVTILKPLHGDESGLARNLGSFCAQDYPVPYEVVFGVSDPADAAIAAVDAVRAAHPGTAVRLVVDGRRRGRNGKVSNLINMAEHARYDMIVLADSDMAVGPAYLRGLAVALAEPGVGAVTCLYRGVALPNLWSRLAARWIDWHFLPNVMAGLTLGLAKPCFGSTIAMRRDTLERIGGFAAVKDKLADDYALGEAVRGLGLTVAVPRDMVLEHLCAATTGAALLRQELRWARTIRAVDPFGFAGSVVTHPLPFALLAVLASGCSVTSLAVLAMTLALRASLRGRVARFIGEPMSVDPVAGFVRDLLAFAVFLMSFLPGSIDWRGHRFVLRADGTLDPHHFPSPDTAGP